jgi:hypothetical protein
VDLSGGGAAEIKGLSFDLLGELLLAMMLSF